MIRKFRREQIDEAIQFLGYNDVEILEWTKGAFAVKDNPTFLRREDEFPSEILYRVSDHMEVAEGEWIFHYIRYEEDDDHDEWLIFTDETMRKYFVDITEKENE